MTVSLHQSYRRYKVINIHDVDGLRLIELLTYLVT